MVTVTQNHPAMPLAPIRTPDRPQEPTVRTQTATLRDADDQSLAIIELAWPLTADEVMLGEIDDQSWLMAYYFGHGGRDVTLTLADAVVSARLETRWEGNHRVWWLDFQNET